MSRLLARGYIAALAPNGVPNFDIVVTSVDGSHLCAFQVKTRWNKGSDGGWHMRPKHEDLSNDRIFYCFVDLGKSAEDHAKVYVIPSAPVAHVIKTSHKIWLNTPGKNGAEHKDSPVRRLLPDYSKLLGPDTQFRSGWMSEYLENWQQISEFTRPA